MDTEETVDSMSAQLEEVVADSGKQEIELKEKKPDNTGGEFLKAIAPHYTEAERMRCFRALHEGVFVVEDILERVLKDFRQWRAELSGHADNRSYEKFIRQTFHRDTPELFYLLDGKACLPGYLIPVPVQEGKLAFPFFHGGLIGASDYLHMRDPALDQIEHLKATVDNLGFRLIVETEKGQVQVLPEMVRRYVDTFQNVRKLVKLYPKAQQSQRGALPALVKSVRSMRPIPRNYSLLIPAAYRKDREVQFFRSGELLFVLKKGSLVDCYGLKGKNEHRFLISEFDALSAATRGDIGGFCFERKNRRFIGTVKVDDLRLRIEPVVLKQFVEGAQSARSLQKPLSGLHTLRDYVLQFSKQLASAKRVEKRDLPGHIALLARHDTRFYLSPEFVFLFTPRSEVFACAPRFRKVSRGQNRDGQHDRSSGKGGGPKKRSGGDRRRRRRRKSGGSTKRDSSSNNVAPEDAG